MALRNGYPKDSDTEAVSPYEGYNYGVIEKSKGAAVSLVKLFKDYPGDFDATVAKPTAGPYFKRDSDDREFLDNYEINLERIDKSWITHYMENCMFDMRKNKNGSERRIREEQRDQQILTDDENESHEEVDFAMDDIDDELSPIVKEKHRKKLHYLIKRLSMFGAANGFHMMSLVIAHEKAKRFLVINKVKASRNAGRAKQQDILKFGYFAGDSIGGYKLNYEGEPIIRDQNKGDYAAWIHDFIIGRRITGNEEYYDDYMELLSICQELDIDLANEDPREYTAKFISDLAVTYIVSNKDYMSKVQRKSVIHEAIQQIKVSDFVKPVSHVAGRRNIQNKINSESQLISINKMKFFNTTNQKVLEYRNVDSTGIINVFLEQYKDIYSEIELLDRDSLFEDGFIADSKTGQIKVFPAVILRDRDNGLESDRFILHKSGVAVLLRNDQILQFCLPPMYIAYMTAFLFRAQNDMDLELESLKWNYRRVINTIKDQQFPIYKKKYGFWPITD